MERKLAVRFMVPTVCILAALMAFFGFWIDRTLEQEVRSSADRQAQEQLESLLGNLETIDSIVSQQVQTGVKLLIREGLAEGTPSIGKTISAVGVEAPELRLGNVPQAGNYALVDRIKELTGCTATIFVKRGGDFVRISTNVMKPDGTRAIGTILDPAGRAIAQIREGKPFYGVVDILGTPYMTGYEPMKAPSGEIVGIWYVGIRCEPWASWAGRSARPGFWRAASSLWLRLEERLYSSPSVCRKTRFESWLTNRRARGGRFSRVRLIAGDTPCWRRIRKRTS